MISVLHLEDKRATAAKNLSGGTRRKLCVGIALVAHSKVSSDLSIVFVAYSRRVGKHYHADEPTFWTPVLTICVHITVTCARKYDP